VRVSKPVVAACLGLTLVIAAPATAAPPRLSRDHTQANVASAYGSGNFGAWQVDQFGLPIFRYDIDEAQDPKAKQPEIYRRADTSDAWHQIGNDHLQANAYNHGYVELWSQDRLMQWANRYDPSNHHYAGGYGYLNVGGKTVSTLYPDRSQGTFEREFGVGYYRKHVIAEGIDVDQRTFAPFGDDPLLLDQVTIANTTGAAKKVSWFEYWDVNPYNQASGSQHNIGLEQPSYDASSKTLSVQQVTAPDGDTKPLSLFAAALSGPTDGFETSVNAFFGAGTRASPTAVQADKLAGTTALPSPTGASSDQLFAFRAPLELAPGQSITLRYAYGLAHADQIGKLVKKYRDQSDPYATSEKAWANWVPQADFGVENRWVAREIQWDAYLLRSASVYEEECGAHNITQGGYYQYDTGDNLGYRSWLHYLLPIAYAEPELAREILRYSIKWQPPGGPAGALRHWSALHPVRPRHVQRPRLLAAARRRRVRARDARHEVLRRAAHLLRHSADRDRLGAHQGGIRAPGDAARPARRLRDGQHRRLERLLDGARAAQRVQPGHRPARVRVPEARGAGGSEGRQGLRGAATQGRG
jgi:hypothetical protein